MALFRRYFAHILLVKINYIVSPYKEDRPEMSHFNPWYPHGIKIFQCAIYITVHFIIFTYWKLSLLFSESLLSGNHGLWNLVEMQWCNDRLWLHKPFHQIFKYQLTDFVFYHTNIWWATFKEASSRALAVKILIILLLETLSSFLNIYNHFFRRFKFIVCFWFSFKRCTCSTILNS